MLSHLLTGLSKTFDWYHYTRCLEIFFFVFWKMAHWLVNIVFRKKICSSLLLEINTISVPNCIQIYPLLFKLFMFNDFRQTQRDNLISFPYTGMENLLDGTLTSCRTRFWAQLEKGEVGSPWLIPLGSPATRLSACNTHTPIASTPVPTLRTMHLLLDEFNCITFYIGKFLWCLKIFFLHYFS